MDNQSDSDESDKKQRPILACPIPSSESDFISRLKSIIRDESIVSFSKRCGMPESTIRSYLARGKTPNMDHLVSISAAAGVTVDWLATGKGVKYSKDLKAAIDRLDGSPPGAAGELPLALEPYRRRLDALHGYLAQIDDDRDRDRIIADFLLRAEETKKIGELEQAVTELRSALNKKNL